MSFLPPWLNIGNIIRNLDFSGWLRKEQNNYVGTQINAQNIHVYQNPVLEPVVLKEYQQELCNRLDDLWEKHKLSLKPSDIYKGAVFAMRFECKENDDRIAQVAHSLREILYPFGNDAPKKEVAFLEYGSVRSTTVFTQEVGRIFGTLTELSHHGNGKGKSVDFKNFTYSKFEQLVFDFEQVMLNILSKQIDIHNEIDHIIKNDPTKLL